MRLGLIWAQAADRVIGADGGMPWRLPEDARHFREITTGSTVLMGRKTWESLPERFRPLPDRRNLVVTRDAAWRSDGAESFGSIDVALDAAETADDVDGRVVWVIGGGELYAATIGRAAVLEVTEIDAEIPGDTRAPQIDPTTWRPSVTGRDADWATSVSGVPYRFVRYTRWSTGA